jgi:hypothetical protein
MTTETSVALSLAELTQIEEERIEREKSERAKERAARIRREREAEAERQAEEEARMRADEAARTEQARRDAQERALFEAREQAERDVARIQAEAKVRLEADNAMRAHELAVLRTQRETGRRRREILMAVALVLAAAVGGATTWNATSRANREANVAGEHQERERSLLRERDEQKRVELQALERRHAVLSAKPRAADAKRAKETAEAARAAIDPRAPTTERMRTFADSLDAFDTRIAELDRLAQLDRRRDDLSAWATSLRKSGRLDSVDAAALRARAEAATADDIAAYERALDQLADDLGGHRSSGGRPAAAADTPHDSRTCREGDPGCGLDGRPLF